MVTNKEYEKIPVLKQAMRIIAFLKDEDKIKLTSRGYLPTKYVKELYPLGVRDTLIEIGASKLSKELDSNSVQISRILLEMSGIIKKRNNVLTLTKKGNDIADNSLEVFRIIFFTYCNKFNWGYFDGYEFERIGGYACSYSIYLLSLYGSEKRTTLFYANKYFEKFPELQAEIYDNGGRSAVHCYICRTFSRFCKFFGLIEYDSKSKAYIDEETLVWSSDIVIEVKNRDN